MSAATAPASTIPRKPLRERSAAVRGDLPFPIPAPGEAAFVGYGNWDTYLMLDGLIGSRSIRVRYNAGIIEIMSISPLHERLKTRLGRFLEAFCDHIGKRYEMLGSATQAQEGRRAAEPDESYAFGPGETDKPDLAVEVALSSGGMDKLSLWASLGVPELWVWQNGALHVFQLQDGRYAPATDSSFLPGFPFHFLPEILEMKNGSEAVREFRRRLADGK